MTNKHLDSIANRVLINHPQGNYWKRDYDALCRMFNRAPESIEVYVFRSGVEARLHWAVPGGYFEKLLKVPDPKSFYLHIGYSNGRIPVAGTAVVLHRNREKWTERKRWQHEYGQGDNRWEAEVFGAAIG